MKSIFKRKTLIALNLMLLLGMSTKGHTNEGGNPPQSAVGTASNGTPISVAVTVDGGFNAPYRGMLTRVDTAVVRDLPLIVEEIGASSDSATAPTLFGRHRQELDLLGAPSDSATALTLFGRNRREIDLLEEINTSITSGTGGTSTSLTEVLTRIGDVSPHGSDLFTEIARILLTITAGNTALTRSITDSETTVLAAIARIATSVGTGNTDITSILRLIGAAPVSLYQTIIDGDRQIRVDIGAIATLIGSISSCGGLYQTIIDGDTRILNAIGGISTTVGTGNTSLTQILTNIGILMNFMGAPTGHHHHTLFSTLYTILEEVRTTNIGTPHGFKKYLKVIHEGQQRLEEGQAQLGNGMVRLLQQLCVGDAGEKYLPKALVGINDGVQQILDRLSHSGASSPALPSRESRVIIELLEESSEKTEVLARSNLHIHKELREIREQTARVVEILEDDDRRPSSPTAKSDIYEELVETVGHFERPRQTVAGSLEAIVDGFKVIATHEHVTVLTKGLLALNNQQVEMSHDMREMKQELRETKGMLAQLIAALSSHRPHHDGHDSGSESDGSSAL